MIYYGYAVGVALTQAADWLMGMRCDKQSHVVLMTSLASGESPWDTPTEYINRAGQWSR